MTFGVQPHWLLPFVPVCSHLYTRHMWEFLLLYLLAPGTPPGREVSTNSTGPSSAQVASAGGLGNGALLYCPESTGQSAPGQAWPGAMAGIGGRDALNQIN